MQLRSPLASLFEGPAGARLGRGVGEPATLASGVIGGAADWLGLEGPATVLQPALASCLGAGRAPVTVRRPDGLLFTPKGRLRLLSDAEGHCEVELVGIVDGLAVWRGAPIRLEGATWVRFDGAEQPPVTSLCITSRQPALVVYEVEQAEGDEPLLSDGLTGLGELLRRERAAEGA